MTDKKQKIKAVLNKAGLLSPARTVYYGFLKVYYYFIHKKCEFEARKRIEGKDDCRFSKLKELNNIYDGKRCFIVATGPSLRIEDVDRLKDEFTFSMNSIIKLYGNTSWRPTYYAIQDAEVFKELNKDSMFDNVENILVADVLVKRVKFKGDFIQYPIDLLNHETGEIKHYFTNFSDNAYAVVYDGSTITYSLMQIAVYMGFKEIYLLGCDCDYSGEKTHFVDYGFSPVMDPSERMLAAYQVAKKYADTHGIKICNATRGGKLEIFERVDFDSLF